MAFKSKRETDQAEIPLNGGLSDSNLAKFAYSMWWERQGADLPESDDLRKELWDAERPESLQLARKLLRNLNFNGFVVTRS